MGFLMGEGGGGGGVNDNYEEKGIGEMRRLNMMTI